ncbi:MAG: thioredoxin domain-containing protein, partial [Kineosporiaceae bacterium]
MPNRLARSTSPYLQQHAGNPVEWWEWSPEAFADARRRDVPVLLSVGYAACHWCHVMASESFDDPDTAGDMNARFVSVKVDREERPDVDAVYMQATTALTGHGGWPMTVFLTPDGRPFHAGTYFPPEPRHGMPSFRQVLAAVSEAWTERRDEVESVAHRLSTALAGHDGAPGEESPAGRDGAPVAAP